MVTGLSPSGVPDKVGSSQYLDAIKFVSRRELQKAQALNWERSSVADTSAVDSYIPVAYAPPGTLGYGNSGLIVVTTGSTTSKFSDDGTVWGSGLSFGGDLLGTAADVAYGLVGGVPGFLVTSSVNGEIDKSADGSTWLSTTGGVGTKAVLCYAPAPLNLWVAAGDAGTIHTSSDGNTWTARTTPGAWVSNSGGAKRIVWNGSLFVVLPTASPGGYTKCLTSSDGITWTERNLGTNQLWVGLAYSAVESKWMAVADSGAVVTSPDGITWNVIGSGPGYGMKDLAVLGSLWVAPTRLAVFGGVTFSLDNGATWTTVRVGNHRVATDGWSRIIAADKRFVLVHATGTALEFALSERAL